MIFILLRQCPIDEHARCRFVRMRTKFNYEWNDALSFALYPAGTQREGALPIAMKIPGGFHGFLGKRNDQTNR